MNYRKQRWSESEALKYHKYVIDYGAARAASFQAVVVVVEVRRGPGLKLVSYPCVESV